MAEAKRILGAAVTIIDDGSGKILLVKRCDCGKWGLPGGLLEFGETLDQTALRETKEETGLDVEIDELWGVYSGFISRSTGNQPITAAFTAHITGGELFCDHVETQELRWFGRDELPEIYSAQHSAMIEDYFSGAKGAFR